MSVRRLVYAVIDVVIAAIYLLAVWSAVLMWGLPAAIIAALLTAVGVAYAVIESDS